MLSRCSFELMHKVNLSEQVAKMLSGCNDIIKQHKDACMKITALMACKDSLWVGTSSGVLLTVHKPANKPVVTGNLVGLEMKIENYGPNYALFFSCSIQPFRMATPVTFGCWLVCQKKSPLVGLKLLPLRRGKSPSLVSIIIKINLPIHYLLQVI